MKKIDISQIRPGMVVESDWYSEKQELLISRGTTISDRHLEVLRRRKIFDIFFEGGSDEDEELQNLLAVKFSKLEEIDFSDDLPDYRQLEGLGNIQKGAPGLRQLSEGSFVTELDKTLRLQRTADKPVGPALKDKVTELTALERSDTYKTDIATAYNNALKQVHVILQSLIKGHRVEGQDVAVMVKRLVDIFVTDRNILLNISSTKPSGDNYLYHHSLNVCLLAINIAASVGYSEKQVIEIGMGALLHDLGMFLLPRDIVLKKGRLTQEEWYEIQKHPILGLHLLEKMKRLPESVAYVAYQTHERENRSGYPKQRGAQLIHRFAKIVQIADIYESHSSPRPYRQAYIAYESMERIVKMTRSGLISGDFVKAFLCYASLFPVGSLVELNDKRIAKVIRANGASFAKPLVCVLAEHGAEPLPKSQRYEVDLSVNINVYITKAHSSQVMNDICLMDGF